MAWIGKNTIAVHIQVRAVTYSNHASQRMPSFQQLSMGS